MAGRCSVCNHPQRHEIDVSLVEGATNRHVMARFGVGRMAVQRHRQEHVPDSLWRSRRVKELTQGDELMGRVLRREQRGNDLYDAAWAWHQRALAANDPDVSLRAIAEARRVLGELRQTAALLFGRRDIRDLEERLDALEKRNRNNERRKGYAHG